MAAVASLDAQSSALVPYRARELGLPGYANQFRSDRVDQPVVIYHIHKWETVALAPPHVVTTRERALKIAGLVLKIFGAALLVASVVLACVPTAVGNAISPGVASIGGLVLLAGYKIMGEDLKPNVGFKVPFGTVTVS